MQDREKCEFICIRNITQSPGDLFDIGHISLIVQHTDNMNVKNVMLKQCEQRNQFVHQNATRQDILQEIALNRNSNPR